MRKPLLLAFIITTGVQAQEDPMDLLRRVQARVADSADRMPRYMCTQTVDRAIYERDVHDRGRACDEGFQRRVHLTSSDRLRLDVGITTTAEIYAWVGESRFNDRDLLDMVHEGAISTGSFGAYLNAIFRTDDASFTYNGETTQDGRALSEFGYRVPYEKSHYRYGLLQHSAITGYDGTFLVDTNTADLVRLVVRTSRLPSETGACYASTTLDYGRVRLRGADFLLPSASTLRIFHIDGGEAENRTVFSSCHEFLGESSIKFDSPSDILGTEPHHGPGAQAFSIPAGLPFRVVLTQGIDTASAAAGDPIKAKLITPLQGGSKVLVPMGAAIAGRIVRIRRFYGHDPALYLDIRLETVEVGGVSLRLTATPDGGRSFQKARSGSLQRRVELGTLRGVEDRSASFVFRNARQPYLIGSGLESMWVTVATGESVSTVTK